ncbi:MAG: nodulation protein NfeD [Actinobacteria bacterium]|nr:nodulation protein NfeD [Actinomycetota bacterium]
MILIIALFFAVSVALGAEDKIHLVKLEGVIDPSLASYFERSLKEAERTDSPILVLLDTPGGLDTSMRQIIKDILNSKVPVIVYVYPSGARAASAGCFIALSANIAAMAPGTNIGAAHPVNLFSGESTSVVDEKVVNDAAAYIRSICEKRGRNSDWAEMAVRKNASATEKEALQLNVIDVVASSIDELLQEIDGTVVEVYQGKKYILKTKNSRLIQHNMNLIDRILHTLSNPTIAYLLLIIGFYGLIYEFANPGIGFAGIGGTILIILSLYALHILSANMAAIALIILGVVLFVAEAFTPGFGLLAGGGIVSFIVGSLFLFERGVAFSSSYLTAVISASLITLIFISIVVSAAIKAQRRRVVTGKEGMRGLKGKAYSDLKPDGRVFVRGEIWKAESVDGNIEKGEEIEVVEVEGLKLIVRRPERK